MKAVGYFSNKSIDAEDALLDLDIPSPDATGRDLKVAVRAVSVNPADVKLRASRQPKAGVAQILGFDASGVVESVGEDVSIFKPGDEVFYAGAIDRPGTNSQFHLVDERIVGHKPKSVSFAEAAALPLTAITAWEILFDRFRVNADQTGSLLIINGAGGVGSILTQLARKLTKLTVISTASRDDTVEWCKAMGAHHVINHRKPLSAELLAIGIKSVDFVAGLNATDKHLPEISKLIAPQGHLALIDDPDVFDIVPFKSKSVSIHWEFMFTRSMYQTEDMIEQHKLLDRVSELVDLGVLRTTLKENFSPINAANLKKVHAILESGTAIGKAVISDP